MRVVVTGGAMATPHDRSVAPFSQSREAVSQSIDDAAMTVHVTHTSNGGTITVEHCNNRTVRRIDRNQQRWKRHSHGPCVELSLLPAKP